MGSRSDLLDLLQARAHLALGDHGAALGALTGAAPTPEMRLERARALLRSGRTADAQAELRGLDTAEAELLLAFCSPPGQRMQALCGGESRFPQFSGFARARADVLIRQGNLDEGIGILQDALRRVPEDLGLLRQLVRALQKAGRHAQSLVHLRSWSRLATDDPELRLLMARVHTVQGRAAEARRAYLEHLELRPSAHEVRLELARLLLLESGRPDEALPLLEELDAQPSWKQRIAPFRGLALARCGRHSEAEQVLRPLVHSTADADLVAQYAHVVAALGYVDTGRQWARRALQMDPNCQLARELASAAPSP